MTTATHLKSPLKPISRYILQFKNGFGLRRAFKVEAPKGSSNSAVKFPWYQHNVRLLESMCEPLALHITQLLGIKWAASEADERFYRTGDLRYCRSSKDLCRVGQDEKAVKIHGRRLGLGEIGPV